MITTGNVADLARRLRKIPPHEKPRQLLKILAKRSRYPGFPAEFSLECDYPLIHAQNAEEAVYHRRALVDLGYIQLDVDGRSMVTHKGWQHLEETATSRAAMSPDGENHEVEKEYDAFVCYASEDREAVVELLVAALEKRGFRVWYDRTALTIGDSLRRSIDEGLSKSRYGIVVLSRAFFSKRWPQHELDGLLQKEIGGQKVILPVWHGVTHADVEQYSLPLAGRVAGSTAAAVGTLVDELARAMMRGPRASSSAATAMPYLRKASARRPATSDDLRSLLEAALEERADISVQVLKDFEALSYTIEVEKNEGALSCLSRLLMGSAETRIQAFRTLRTFLSVSDDPTRKALRDRFRGIVLRQFAQSSDVRVRQEATNTLALIISIEDMDHLLHYIDSAPPEVYQQCGPQPLLEALRAQGHEPKLRDELYNLRRGSLDPAVQARVDELLECLRWRH